MSIKFENVNYIYSPNSPFEYIALSDINLEIKKGSFTAIIGQTGSGKSTLIQHINALITPTKGNVIVNGYVIDSSKKVEGLKKIRRTAGLVFQFPEYQLFEETIEKDIIFGPLNFGETIEDAKLKAKEVIKLVGLNEKYLIKSPFDLSGGQKRRVAIAGILAMNPDILVLDEPTAGLDPQGAKEMMELFKSLNKIGKTVIIVTHDMNQVLNYCDYAVVMNKGKIIKQGTVNSLFSDPTCLEELSIDLPTITQLIYKLNQKGFNLDMSIKSIDMLVDAIGRN